MSSEPLRRAIGNGRRCAECSYRSRGVTAHGRIVGLQYHLRRTGHREQR
jgi:hypothetical protein